jgi:hypothetical protein
MNPPQLRNITLPFILLAIILLLAVPRLVGLDQFVTVDEPTWLKYSSNFYYALGQRQFERTVYDYHPAVTTMWTVTGALLSYFPEYRGQGQDYFVKDWQFNRFLASFGKQPLELLLRSRLISVLAITLLLTASFLLGRALLGTEAALAATLLISFDPYFLGHSRLLNHEGFLAAATLASILSMLVYLEKSRKLSLLYFSGICAGLALLTKSSAILLIGLTGLMILGRVLGDWQERSARPPIYPYILALLAWLGVSAAVFFLLWPGMWVNPAKMLYEVFGNALSYAFQGSRLSVTGAIEPSSFSLDSSGLRQYLNVLLWGITPLVWLGFLLAWAGFFLRGNARVDPIARKLTAYLSLLAILFVLLFGTVRGRDSAHYILTSFVCLDFVAGIGLATGVRWLGGRFGLLAKRSIRYGLLLGVLLLHALSSLPNYPYYYTYASPLARAVLPDMRHPSISYGEGLELAAAHLAQKPNASELTVLSYNGIGPFSYFFPGETHILKTDDRFLPEELQELKEADYIVIYSVQQKPRDGSTALLTALEAIPPEKIIWLDGVKYASIYAVDQFPQSLFTAISE